MADPVVKNDLQTAKKAIAFVERYMRQGGHVIPEGMDDLQRLIDNPEDMLRVVRYIQAGLPMYWKPFSIEEPDSHRRARDLMGANFQGIVAAQKLFGNYNEAAYKERLPLRLYDEDRGYLSEDETLALCEECRETHLMQATHDLSIIDIYACLSQFFDIDQDEPWFADPKERKWADVPIVRPWQLICKDEIPGSQCKDISMQKLHIKLVRPKERLTLPIEHIYGSLLHKSHTGKQLCEKYVVRFMVQTAYGPYVLAKWFKGRLRIFHGHKDDFDLVVCGSVRTIL